MGRLHCINTWCKNVHTLLGIRWYCRTGVINVIFRITLKIDRSEAALSKGVIITTLFTPPPPPKTDIPEREWVHTGWWGLHDSFILHYSRHSWCSRTRNKMKSQTTGTPDKQFNNNTERSFQRGPLFCIFTCGVAGSSLITTITIL